MDGEPPPLLPSTPRPEVAARTRDLADLVERSLPSRVRAAPPDDFQTVSVLLLARLAGLARSVATMLEAQHELDAWMLMRAAVEHMTLLAWLAIDPLSNAGGTEIQAAALRTSEEKTRWWIADQISREQRAMGHAIAEFPQLDSAEFLADVNRASAYLATERNWGPIPTTRKLAALADAHWGGSLDGWPDASPGDASYGSTLRGFYRTLYQAGNSSAHPHIGVLASRFTQRVDAKTTMLRVEQPGDEVDPLAAITAYVVLYAVGVAESALGWKCLDDALRILGRWQDVRGPGELLLRRVHKALGEGRHYGSTEGQFIKVEFYGDTTAVVLVSVDEWVRLRHAPGPRWTLDDSSRTSTVYERSGLTGEITQQMAALDRAMQHATWLEDDPLPGGWPQDVS